MAAKVKHLCTEEKPSFAYLCICLRAKKITALGCDFVRIYSYAYALEQVGTVHLR
jgi:hypothetical protein